MTQQWLNEPDQWSQSPNGIHVSVGAGTDFWRKTHDNGIRDNGHFFYLPVTGDFRAVVRLAGEYREQYDQAGLMARVNETTWLKCGIELVDGTHLASVVVTRDWSDWSVRPVAEASEIWWKLKRHGSTFEASFSIDAAKYDVMRQAYLTSAPQLDIGFMACAPKGDGFRVTFHDFEVSAS